MYSPIADDDIPGWKSRTLGLHGCYIAESKGQMSGPVCYLLFSLVDNNNYGESLGRFQPDFKGVTVCCLSPDNST